MVKLCFVVATVFALDTGTSALAQQIERIPVAPDKPAAVTLIDGKPALSVMLTDGSALKVSLLDDNLELVTPYGALRIPCRDIRRVELAHRVTSEDESKLAVALDDLASKDFKTRQTATDALFALREKALPGLHKVAKSSDAEVVKRAESILARLQELLGEEGSKVRTHDVVHTADSKIAGKLSIAALRVRTTAFGVQSLALVNVRGVSFAGHEEDAPIASAINDPGNLTNHANEVGRVFIIRVKGTTQRTGSIYGTGTYTCDSMLALAAVHAGLVKDGQVGYVKATILGQHPAFEGTTRNGVTTASYGAFPGYRLTKVVRE